MLGLRLNNDVQKRWKKGSPHHSTTGVASRNSSQGRMDPAVTMYWSPLPTKSAFINASGQIMLPIAIASKGAVRTTPTQKRRVMFRSSGFSSGPAVTVRGSSAMPQMGHEPGSERMISGCMGQVYSVRAAITGTSASRAMPQAGQAPGRDSCTSGHMGQTYAGVGDNGDFAVGAIGARGMLADWIEMAFECAPSDEVAGLGADGIPGVTRADGSGTGLFRYPAGLALNFSRHRAAQK